MGKPYSITEAGWGFLSSPLMAGRTSNILMAVIGKPNTVGTFKLKPLAKQTL